MPSPPVVAPDPPSAARFRLGAAGSAVVRTVLPMAVGLLWLLAVGAVRYELPERFRLAGVAGLMVLFVGAHLAARRPRRWASDRFARGGAAAIDVAFALGAAVLLWFGSVAWHVSTGGALTSPGDPVVAGLSFVLAAVVLMPLVEEVTFRGWIQPFWESRVGAAVAIVGTAILFSVLHIDGPVWPRFVGGLLLGTVAWAGKSVWLAVGLHVAHNGAAVLLPRVPPVDSALDGLSAFGVVPLRVVAAVAYGIALVLCTGWVIGLRRRTPEGARPTVEGRASAIAVSLPGQTRRGDMRDRGAGASGPA